MSYINYKAMPSLIASLRPFRGNTMDARIVDGIYTVYSYNTPILRIDVATGDWELDNRRYSVTTSKQQNYVRMGLHLRGIRVGNDRVIMGNYPRVGDSL